VDNNSVVILSPSFYLRGATLTVASGSLSPTANVTIRSGGVLQLHDLGRTSGYAWGSYGFPVALTVAGGGKVQVRGTAGALARAVKIWAPSLAVHAGGIIEADSAGYAGGVADGAAAQGA
jgi:hypothetical protein